MLAHEALEVLGLAADASPAEIKAAHRDLVKVWHPDRFGHDLKLRAKAEERLKQINKAYTVLQVSRSNAAASPAQPPVSEPVHPPAQPVVRRSRASLLANIGLWAARVMGTLLVIGIGFALFRGVGQPSPLEQPTAPAAAETTATGPEPGSAASVPTAAIPAAANDREPAKNLGRATAASPPPLQIRTLSEKQTAQLDAACEAQKAIADPSAYQACAKAQIDLLTNTPGEPNLSRLTAAERESIELACSAPKRLHGDPAYDRCLTAQMADWASQPARPDLSGLNDTDRSSIEAACRGAKAQGPAAYDRCRARFVKLLAESK